MQQVLRDPDQIEGPAYVGDELRLAPDAGEADTRPEPLVPVHHSQERDDVRLRDLLHCVLKSGSIL